MERVFGWVWVALCVAGIVAVAVGAHWHWFTAAASALMAWGCFAEAKERDGELAAGVGGQGKIG